jgi:hypothetical protein
LESAFTPGVGSSIEEEALAAITANEGATRLLVVPWLVRRAAENDVHQHGPAAARREYLLNAAFLAEALYALDVPDLHSFLCRQTLGTCAKRLAERQRELVRVVRKSGMSRRSSVMAIACSYGTIDKVPWSTNRSKRERAPTIFSA